jgi:hypothetical protein
MTTAATTAITTTTTTSLSRSQNTGCSKWWIISLGTASRKNTNIHPFVSPAKGVKKREAPHINIESSPLCVDVFCRIFSSASGTDQRILPATLSQTSQT